MGPKTTELVVVLDQVITLLEGDGETHWLAWMQNCKDQIESSDYCGITSLLGAYGGMGSFNDLVLCQRQENGKFYWTDCYREKNKILNELREKAFQIANEISRANRGF